MAKKEIKNSDLVELLVTEEEKAAITKFLLEKEKTETKEAIDAASNEGTMFITLFAKHGFGRKEYGPGRTEVPVGIAGQIIYQDQKAQGREIALNTTNKRLIQVMQSGQRIEMNPSNK